jgi:multimeric flavodoxin WrbA
MEKYMNVTVINGSPRKGNTYAATQIFKNEMPACGSVNFTEFFLPQDLPEFCKGCMQCYEKGEQKCPDSEYTLPILDTLLKSDAIIFTTPVYVLQETGAVKAFLDHFGFMFVVHRARPEMFSKKAFIISTTAGAGTRAAMKTISTNLKFWGVNRIYKTGFAMRAISWETVNTKRREKFEKKLKKSARKFYKETASGKKRRAYLFTRIMFLACRGMVKKYDETTSLDKKYWIEQNWFKNNPF